MKKEKLVKISKELVSDGKTPIQNLRRNLSMYISSPGITLKDISDGADISFDTLDIPEHQRLQIVHSRIYRQGACSNCG